MATDVYRAVAHKVRGRAVAPVAEAKPCLRSGCRPARARTVAPAGRGRRPTAEAWRGTHRRPKRKPGAKAEDETGTGAAGSRRPGRAARRGPVERRSPSPKPEPITRARAPTAARRRRRRRRTTGAGRAAHRQPTRKPSRGREAARGRESRPRARNRAPTRRPDPQHKFRHSCRIPHPGAAAGYRSRGRPGAKIDAQAGPGGDRTRGPRGGDGRRGGSGGQPPRHKPLVASPATP